MQSNHDKLGRLKAMRKRLKRAIMDHSVSYQHIVDMRAEFEREIERVYESLGYDTYGVFLEKYVMQERTDYRLFNGTIVV